MKNYPWHSILLALYSVLFLYAENIKYVKVKDIYSPLGMVILGSALVFALAWFIYRKRIKAGVITSVILLLFFSYGHYVESVYGERIFWGGVALDHNFYKWSALILCLLLFWRLWKTKSSLLKLNSLLNFIALVLFVMPLYKIGNHLAAKSRFFEQGTGGLVAEQLELKSSPTVYYLIMDAYGRNDVLQEMYNYDNSPFTNFLKDKGFYVADSSFSNYNKTVLSIPSSLQMTYLDSLADALGHTSQNQTPLLDLIDVNRTNQNLKSFGYTSFAFDAPILPYLFMDSADLFYETPGAYVNLFENELLNNSVIRAFKRKQAESNLDEYEHHRKKLLTAFDKIIAVSKRPEPYYVHGHILAPHQPFVFNERGEAVNPKHHYTCWYPIEDGRDPQTYRKEYIAQLRFINQKLMETIEAVLKNSKEPPIIIIQGDHGPCSELTNTKSIAGNNFRERMPILNAYYFPDQNYSKLYPGISPVNSFRTVFSQYFGMNYPLLPDSAFYSTWSNHYDFFNVTEEIR